MKLSDITSNFKFNQKPEENDLGFGDKIGTAQERLLNADGSFNIERLGRSVLTPYQELVEMSWGKFFLIVISFYLGVNAVFALLFVFVGVENLSGAAPGGFWVDFANSFFFSVQTFTTVGYGAMSPSGAGANIIAALCALVGLMCFALATGLFFARFSKPTAEIMFSKRAIITPYRNTDVLSFQFRIVNRRNNHMLDLKARLIISYVAENQGLRRRYFRELALEREQVYFFPLNWTIVHVFDESSPLYGKTREEIITMQAEFLVLIEGYDETFATTVHTNSSYTCDEIDWGVRFMPMYYTDEKKGRTVLELEKISATSPVEVRGSISTDER